MTAPISPACETARPVPSPNAPRPPEGSLARELADILAAIERNYGREGSGPGTRFEGQLLEDVQAQAVLRRVADFAEKHDAAITRDCACPGGHRGGRGRFASVLREAT